MQEEWRNITIPGLEDKYLVSNFGNVYSVITGKNLSIYTPKDGRPVVHLQNGTITKQCRVHRLVAEAFIPNPNNLPQVNHKDENKENNCVDNLEWCTCKYNINYGTHNKRTYQTNVIKGNWKDYRELSSEEHKTYEKQVAVERSHNWYVNNKERAAERQKEYRLKNKEKIREYHKLYYKRKKEENSCFFK